MRIAGLSERTGVSVATLKFYVREGLLHAGMPTAVNQATYDESHVRRVRLVRSLLELGGLSLGAIKGVLNAVDDESVPLHTAFGVAQDALVPRHDVDGSVDDEVVAEVERFVDRHGLRLRPDAQVRHMLAEALAALRTFGWACDARVFDELVPGAMAQAEFEVSTVPLGAPRAEQMETTVVGTIAFEAAGNAIRRMALEHMSELRFGTDGGRTRPASRRRP